MPIAQRRARWLVVLLLLMGCTVFAPGGERLALASSPEQAEPAGSDPWNGVKAAAMAILTVGLAAGAVHGTLWFARRRQERLQEMRFVREADAPVSGVLRAIAVVSVPGLSPLFHSKYYGAMESLRLYLEATLEPGERFYRIRRYEYGLCLVFRDREALTRRLQMLQQDVGFLYMASHPGLDVKARVAACPLSEAQGAMDALRQARAQIGESEHGG